MTAYQPFSGPPPRQYKGSVRWQYKRGDKEAGTVEIEPTGHFGMDEDLARRALRGLRGIKYLPHGMTFWPEDW